MVTCSSWANTWATSSPFKRGAWLNIASTSKQRISYHSTTVTRKGTPVKSNKLAHKTYGCKTQVYSRVERQRKSDERRQKEEREGEREREREREMKFQG